MAAGLAAWISEKSETILTVLVTSASLNGAVLPTVGSVAQMIKATKSDLTKAKRT